MQYGNLITMNSPTLPLNSVKGLKLSRRGFLALPAVAAAARFQATSAVLGNLNSGSSRVTAPDGQLLSSVVVRRQWTGNRCALAVENRSPRTVRIGEVTAFDFRHRMAANTPFYAEGFQMLSQTGGTIAQPEALGGYTDAKHYKLPEAEGALTAYNLAVFEPATGGPVLFALFAFTSCQRFTGKFHLRPETLEIGLDGEGLPLAPGQTMDLEEFAVFEGRPVAAMLSDLAARIATHHPPICQEPPPQGWCSWYCFGPSVTAEQVMDNLEFIAKNLPALRYIQIDDGYQPAMGDWLETGKAFGGDVQTVLKQIRQRGFEPAIWVAPFIAEKDSKLFREHPDWFMKDDQGDPLPSDKVTFGGWRKGPWYALDGTHPEARAHLENVFRVMRRDWGVTYFKLDANFWGAMPRGRLHDLNATRVEAYRRGMEAVRRGAGDAFILGCNHPLWPSLGLIHGSRSSNDISRRWARFQSTARENLRRGWQNGRLWWNDPDVALLSPTRTSTDGRPSTDALALGDNEFSFHLAAIYASGGLLLSGDDLPHLPESRVDMLRKMSPPLGRAATFVDREMTVATHTPPPGSPLIFFNWGDQPAARSHPLPARATVKDFWTGEVVKTNGDLLRVEEMAPRPARIFTLTEPPQAPA
jgi:alpha-galactosidase